MDKLNIYQKLQKIQKELKAPKSQNNAFGKYKFRSCEDIFEAVKPILIKNDCVLTLTDKLEIIGDRYYIMAKADLRCIENKDEIIEVTAYARETLDEKGKAESQITGSASSYARKYALNGLFLIDDTKDADFEDNTYKDPKKQYVDKSVDKKISEAQIKRLWAIAKDKITKEQIEKAIYRDFQIKKIEELNPQQYNQLIIKIEGIPMPKNDEPEFLKY